MKNNSNNNQHYIDHIHHHNVNDNNIIEIKYTSIYMSIMITYYNQAILKVQRICSTVWI